MIILITGATSGFGAEMARKFVQSGHKVIATGRRKERLEGLVSELRAALLPVAMVFAVHDQAEHMTMHLSLPSSCGEQAAQR